ncbi:MAG: sporulation protein YunB [Clostridia bacterium]|nr:sporulation protein YunB [Clostridia bacterium]
MRRRNRRKRRAGLCFFLVVLLLVAGLVAADSRLRPLVQSYGQMSARRSAMLAVHTAVEQVLSQADTAYHSFVAIERDSEGHVLSAETDVTAINRLKAEVSNAVMRELTAREKQTVKLPLGSLLGGSFFTGRGPFLPITIHTSGTAITTLSGEFSDAGINQTNHSIYLDMTVMVTAALPMERVTIELATRFLVCETVLVGEVPQTVLQVDFGEGMQKFFGAAD